MMLMLIWTKSKHLLYDNTCSEGNLLKFFVLKLFVCFIKVCYYQPCIPVWYLSLLITTEDPEDHSITSTDLVEVTTAAIQPIKVM